MKDVRINPETSDIGKRIDSFLAENFKDYTRSHIKKLIEEGYVFFDTEKITKAGQKITRLQDIIIKHKPPQELSAEAQNIPLEIVFQDKDIAIINKPQGMVVHPAVGNPKDTLVNALMYHLDDLSTINDVIRPGIVHRLDKDTSGLLVIAKNDESHLSLSAQIKEKSAGRFYLALLSGNIKEDNGVISTLIGRSPKDRKQMAVVPNGREAITHFNVLERFIDYTYAEFQLLTGRTHQIRVHAKHINHPVVGDPLYNSSNKFNLNGQLLHAYKLELNHPKTGERMVFHADLPQYFSEILNKLRKK